MPDRNPPSLALSRGRLLACLEVRGDCSEWQAEVDGTRCRAVAFASLAGPLRPGDEVLLNTTAVRLSLGTGGAHFVVAGPASPPGQALAGRESGHILKLRYTPLQHRVLAAEEEASPYHGEIAACEGLGGIPVLAAELHSQAGAAAIAARRAAPGARIVLVHLDSAALPVPYSRLVHRLRADGVLDATVSAGHSFGGDYEAVNVYSGLVVARAAAGADLVLVSQGPGNVGTGTRLGFSGLAVVEALHAAVALGGTPILAPRISAADPRERHRGISHHTRTILECLHVSVTVPLADATMGPTGGAHNTILVDPSPALEALSPYREVLTTMGRTLEEDADFFRAATAAGLYAAGRTRIQST